MASSDTDDDIIISSALLIASTLYQKRQVNVRKRKRNSWTREWIAKRDEYGAYNGLVREIRDTDCTSLLLVVFLISGGVAPSTKYLVFFSICWQSPSLQVTSYNYRSAWDHEMNDTIMIHEVTDGHTV